MEALDIAGDLGGVSELAFSDTEQADQAATNRRVEKFIAETSAHVETNMLKAPPEKR